jgi:ketosteroid isomerase-like protein
MLKKCRLLLTCSIIGCILLISCATSEHNKKGVEAAMKHYDQLILLSDADSIALSYTPDGNLGDVAIGRDSIKKFLSSFKNIRVLTQSSATDSIKITKDTAIQYGKYYQSDLISGKDTVYVKGEFTAKWLWTKDKRWQIKEIHTKAIK